MTEERLKEAKTLLQTLREEEMRMSDIEMTARDWAQDNHLYVHGGKGMGYLCTFEGDRAKGLLDEILVMQTALVEKLRAEFEAI